MTINDFYSNLWEDYIQITPQAEKIRQLFLETDSEVVNDHVAFRTFSGSPIDLNFLKGVVLSLGYQVQDNYDFTVKKLKAMSFIHEDKKVPKVFVSELERHKLSDASQAILARYCDQIQSVKSGPGVFWSGRHWQMPSFDDYATVLDESEYAAWLLVIGLRVNHFTVNVNLLHSTDRLEDVLDRVQAAGFAINESGGRIKGTPDVLLEQGSTMADRIKVSFSDGQAHFVPSCFYEFAKRYKNSQGELYQGFVAANADKIFESTSSK